MYNSLQIRVFDDAIKKFVSESPLPDEVKRMVLEKRLAEQTEKTFETLQKEILERDRKETKKNAKNVSKN